MKFQLLASVVFLGITLGCSAQGNASQYSGGLSACAAFRRTLPQISQGVLTDGELRGQLQTIQSQGSTAEPPIQAASTAMLRGATQGDAEGLLTGIEAMAQACANSGY